MYLLHTADWHLGKALFGRSLLEDQAYFLLEWLLPLLDRERPDAVLLAGDVFDRQVPPTEAVLLFDEFLRGLQARNLPLLAVTGNHDGEKRLSLGTSFLRREGVVLATRPQDLDTPYVLKTKAGESARFYFLPYCTPAAAREVLGDDSIHTQNDAYRALLGRLELPDDLPNVLITHCFAAGSTAGASENPAFVGPASQVGLDCFSPFSYVALGHLHRPQKAGPGRYAGAPLAYSFDEEGQEKSVTRVFLEHGAVHCEELPFVPPRRVRRVRGLFAELLAQAQAAPSEDYLFVSLTDPAPVYQPLDRLRPYWPNVLTVANECFLHMGTGETAQLREEIRQHRAGDEAVFRAFLKEICGEEATDADLKHFAKTQKEVSAL